MTAITAALVRELREKSGAGMMECKRALEVTSGNLEAAFDELRKAGLKTAAKKAGRTTGEGRVWCASSADNRSGAMVAISCETDFVANTPDFQAFLHALAQHVLAQRPADVAACLAQAWSQGGTVDDALKGLIGRLGENIQLSSVCAYSAPEGGVATYVHHDNKKGAIVKVQAASPDLSTMRDLCMHIVAFNPSGLNRAEIPQSLIDRERAIIAEELQGRPAEIQEKIMAGRLEKFYADLVITEQAWIKDEKVTVQKALEAAMGAGTTLLAYSRLEVGVAPAPSEEA